MKLTLKFEAKIGTIGIDEYNKYLGLDTSVRIIDFYTDPRGWYVIRPIDKATAKTIIDVANIAYRNSHIVYDMENCYEIINKEFTTKERTCCNASTLIRAILEKALDAKLPDFTTASMCYVLENTEFFQPKFRFLNFDETPLEIGDILVTQTKGNCVTVLDVDYVRIG